MAAEGTRCQTADFLSMWYESCPKFVPMRILFHTYALYQLLFSREIYWYMRIRRPRLQQGERVREDITSSKGQASRSKQKEQAAEERKNKLQEQATAKREEESKVQEQEASQQAEAMGNRKKERKCERKPGA